MTPYVLTLIDAWDDRSVEPEDSFLLRFTRRSLVQPDHADLITLRLLPDDVRESIRASLDATPSIPEAPNDQQQP